MKKSWIVLASVVFLGAGPVPQQPPMTFFITSAGSGKGADLGGGACKQVAAAKLRVSRVDQLLDRVVDLCDGCLALGIGADRADSPQGGRPRLGNQVGDRGHGRVGGRKVRLVGGQIGLDLRLPFEQPLQADHARRRHGVFAGQLEPSPRAQLRLQTHQLVLVGLDLLEQPTPEELVADSRCRYAEDGHES